MNFKCFATSALALVGRTHCRLAWLTAMVATAIAIGPLDTAAAGSFSLDDNPFAPITSPPGVLPGIGAEDEFGLSGVAGLAPSPSLGIPGVPDGTLFSGTIAGLFMVPNGGYIDAFSINHPAPTSNIPIDFSVDRLTAGIGAVGAEFAVTQQMGDIYRSAATFTTPAAFVGLGAGPYAGLLPTAGSAPGGSNALLFDESTFGLTTAAGVVPPGVPGGLVAFGSHDNVDAYDHSTQVPSPVAGFGLYPVSSYFAVSPDEGIAVGVSAADIFDVAALSPGTVPVPFAAAPTMGLDLVGGLNLDSIDALVMFDGGLIGGPANGGPGAEPFLDFALFSLAPGSASLVAFGLSADDVFFTDFSGAFATYVLGTDIGLFPGPGGPAFGGNNIDALEIPEPSSVALAALALVGLMVFGWRRTNLLAGFLSVIMNRSIKRLISVFSLATCLVVFFSSTSLGTHVGPTLLGPGPLQLLSLPQPQPPLQIRTPLGNFTTGPWTGTWTPPALAAWVGTFNATGPLPSGTSNPAGTTTYDFTALPNGNLPHGTFFRFGDLDFGSATNERFELRAFFNSSVPITAAWLGGPVGVSTGALAAQMPEYSFDNLSGVYTFDGTNVPGNPNIGFVLDNNTPITQLEVIRFSSFASFSLAAPIPEPSSFFLLWCGAACAAGSLLVRGVVRRNRRGRPTAAPT